MPNTQLKILKNMRLLYPTGRAFRMFEGSWLEALNNGRAAVEAQAVEDAFSIQDSMLPDNANFTAADATDWERRLGMITNSSTPLEDRKAAILRKMSYPGRNPARSHYLYLQRQLQLSGFDVYVHENIPVQNPATLNPNILTWGQHGNGAQHGLQSPYINQVVANSLVNANDISFNPGSENTCVFFIGGSTLGTYASVPASRETEFRQTILRLKPVQNTAYLFITYT